ncbi:hypothetical protein Q0F99_15005 [Rathayibacter oskolensis]|uniref:hypothetical protein n=1 Tax=Rathayibacter oskolensis TaxID=1891671 RepID=UPI00265F78D0|nr:hypothetical protein [Rathayibacter oskolensis]WKK70990.1 hypothetical protein Q0F99_15005 [Rathayibacter oskolensis]
MLARSLAHELSAAIQAEQLRAGVEATSSPITEAIPVMTASTPRSRRTTWSPPSPPP